MAETTDSKKVKDDNLSKKKWTIMIYLAGDNNLSEDMVSSLQELKSIAGGPETGIGILAYYDNGFPTHPTNWYDFTEKKLQSDLSLGLVSLSLPDQTAIANRIKSPFDALAGVSEQKDIISDYRVPPPGQSPENRSASTQRKVPGTIESMETPSADPRSIVEFIEWAATKRPADNYMLILSGHGDGFRGKTLLMDDNPAGVLSIGGFKRALSLLKDVHLSIIGFDGCQMNMLEVAYELGGIADIMIASEGDIPDSGWTYQTILKTLIEKNGEQKKEDLAKNIVKNYVESQQEYSVGGRSVTLSACYLDKNYLETVAGKVSQLADLLLFETTPSGMTLEEINDFSPSKYPEIYMNEQLSNLILLSHYTAQTTMFDQAIDLEDFCQILSNKSKKMRNQLKPLGLNLNKEGRDPLQERLEEIEKACDKVVKALQKILIECESSGYEYQFATGVSLFFPWSVLSLEAKKAKYEKLSFCQNKGKKWNNFLKSYLSGTARRHLPKKLQKGAQKFHSNLGFLADGMVRVNPISDKTKGGVYSHDYDNFKNFSLAWDEEFD